MQRAERSWSKHYARLVTVVALAHSATANAHGMPAGVTSVAAATTVGPNVVQVSEGLVQRIDGAWHYVCPVQFGNELTPPAHSIDGERTFVVGDSGLFVLEANGSVTPQNRPEFSRQFVTGLGAAGQQLFAYRFENLRTEIREITATTASPIWFDDAAYDSISTDDAGFWVARTTPDGVGHATRLDLLGATVSEHTFVVEPGEAILRVMEFQDHLYVSTLTAGLTGRLTQLDANGIQTRVADASAPIRGPVAVSTASAFFVADGVLAALPGGAPAPTLMDRAACIGEVGGLVYLCSRTTLLGLDANGTTDVLLDLADLKGPLEGAASAESADRCAVQWLVFQNDLRAIGALPSPDAGDPDASGTHASPAASGCSITRRPTQSRAGGLTLLVALVALRIVRRVRVAR